MNNQIIFNINQKIDWQVDSAHETVNMLPGEVCVFRNKNYATSMNYEGDKNFQFKSLQMTTDFLKLFFPAFLIRIKSNL